MKYKSLIKQYYSDKASYEQEYKLRIDSPACTQLGLDIYDHPAFFVATAELLSLISRIYKKNSELRAMLIQLPDIAYFSYQRSCLIEEILLTNDIEGVYSTRKEINDVISTPEDRSKRFHGLVTKYRLLFEAQHSLSYPLPPSCSIDVRKLYDDIVLSEVVEISEKNAPDGEIFRKAPVHLMSTTQNIKHEGVYPESKIIEYMDHALKVLNAPDLSPLIGISIFHYLFGYIHPFYDGNGRMDRFISSYALSKELHPLVAYRLSFAIKQNKAAYYKAFDICNHEKNRGDITPFIITFSEIIEAAVDDLLEKVYGSSIDLEHYTQKINQAFEGQKEKAARHLLTSLLQLSLFNSDYVSRQVLSESSDLSYPTISNLLKHLKNENAPILEAVEGKNKKLYSIDIDKLEKYLDKRISQKGQDNAHS